MTDETWECICGESCKHGTLCSPRCEFIAEKMKTPFGAKMPFDRAVDFFGKIYDRQRALSQIGTEKSK